MGNESAAVLRFKARAALLALGADDFERVIEDARVERESRRAPPKAPASSVASRPKVRRPRIPVKTAADSGSRSEVIVSALKSEPRIKIRKLAEKVYGESTRETQNRVRSLLAMLKKKGTVKSAGPGLWEAA